MLHLLFKGASVGQITRVEKGEERAGCSSPFIGNLRKRVFYSILVAPWTYNIPRGEL